MLELVQLNAWRDDRCLYTDLSINVQAGDVLHVQGANGAGKTTLLQQLAGLRASPKAGVLWQQQPAFSLESEYIKSLIYLGHLSGLKAALTVAENLKIMASLRQQVLSEQQIEQALLQVGLYGYEESPVQQLSAGQKRRVALARLYLEPAKLWLLDEPFSSLDKQGVADLEQCIIRFAVQGGMVLLTTHHPLSAACAAKALNLSTYAQIEGDD
ncbi:MAG: cytochrome c biogenesis heme-transporting ATPase CcmA [Moraxellaceae bacterium]|nr:cytochrome c biogenesis heme-transporting ATPase CcmA [Moraxellaceae bacterium]MDP1775480.1 cytochrome c biogenesis heme-transporting ATPase CcmA [Moraxellaceae bacterium]MDZ4298887.1 cytochrome c biogenesis heme-transporting ATPase CcmA [Moraxellaceae bacterium]MDZ4387102.1 cytochrome c biogenesis heme-transporting ATPase CcmA [Moraxellaceae bacterium]